jgi:hypothetical protein
LHGALPHEEKANSRIALFEDHLMTVVAAFDEVVQQELEGLFGQVAEEGVLSQERGVVVLFVGRPAAGRSEPALKKTHQMSPATVCPPRWGRAPHPRTAKAAEFLV